jgi:hypothetical protein
MTLAFRVVWFALVFAFQRPLDMIYTSLYTLFTSIGIYSRLAYEMVHTRYTTHSSVTGQLVNRAKALISVKTLI